MLRTLIAPVILAALAACASTPPEAPTPDIRVINNRIFLPAELNGVPTQALLDSGAELSLVDTGFARQLALAAFGDAEAKGTGAGTESVQFADGVTLSAAGVTLENAVVAILDLTDVSARLTGTPLTLVLGRELFDAHPWHLDIEAGTFRRLQASDLPDAGAAALTDAHGIKQIDILINGVPAKADFDLGNGSEVLVSQAFAERAGLMAPGNVLGTKQGGGIGGAVERTLVRADTLEVGGKVLKDVTLAVDPQAEGADANIGISVLRHFVLTIDYAGNRVWLVPRP